MELRLVTSKDIADGMALKDLAGWNQPLSTGNDFCLPALTGCFAAKDRERVVGTSATIVYEGRVAWIGMVIVDPIHRSAGLGTALLQRAIDHLDSRKLSCVKLDATAQGRTLYQKS